MTRVIRAPFAGNSLLHYPITHQITEWREVDEFDAALTLMGMERGRSAAYFIWQEDYTHNSFPMFLVDMADLLKRDTVSFGTVLTTWKIMKRGQNYGIAKV